MPKSYIGDSVYADFDGYHVVLTTENGLPTDPSNTIALDPRGMRELSRYAATTQGARDAELTSTHALQVAERFRDALSSTAGAVAGLAWLNGYLDNRTEALPVEIVAAIAAELHAWSKRDDAERAAEIEALKNG